MIGMKISIEKQDKIIIILTIYWLIFATYKYNRNLTSTYFKFGYLSSIIIEQVLMKLTGGSI